MRFDQIDIAGFGRLQNLQVEFARGLNVVVGPNEAGKSTLLRAIQMFLYGPFTDTQKWANAEVRDKYRPWNGSPYGGTLFFTLATGESYRLERNLREEKTTIYREPGASDVTGEYTSGRHGWVDFADRHLGLSPAVFRASACIHQEALLLEGNDVRALQARLETLADSGGAEQSAQDALKRLASWRAEINPEAVLVERSPLRQADEDVRALRERVGVARDALASMGDLLATERRLAERAEKIRDELASLKGLATLARLRDLESRIDELADVDRRLATARAELDALGDPSELSEADLKAAELSLAEVARARKVVVLARRDVEADRKEREAREAELAEVESGLEDQPPAAWRESELDAARYAIQVWERAEVDLAQARKKLVEIRESRDAHQASRDPSLDGLDVEEVRRAITTYDLRAGEYAQAQADAAKGPVNPVLKAELDDLSGRLRNLSTEKIAELRAIERKINQVFQPPPFRRVLIVTLVLGIVGMGLGYLLATAPGVLVGGLGMAILGYLMAPQFLQPDVNAREIKENRARLLSSLIGTGAQDLDDLEKLWYRRQALVEELGAGRQAREALVRAELAFDDAENALYRLLRVRSSEQARPILTRLEEWHNQMVLLEHQVADSEVTATERDAQLVQAVRRAHQALVAVGADAPSPAEARPRLEVLREEQRRRASLLLRQARVQNSLKDFRARQEYAAKADGVLQEAVRAAGEKLAKLGFDGTVEEGADAVTLVQRRIERGRELRAEIGRWTAAREVLVRDGEPETWAAECERLRAELVKENIREDYAPREVERLVGSRQNELQAIEVKLAQFSTTRAERIGYLEDPALLVEQLAEAEARYNNIRRRLAAVETARELIQKGAEEHRRNFAPRLSAGIGARLAWVTTGKYSQVEIAPENLTVRLKSTDRGGLVTLDQVSTGTRDAVALLLRVGIVDLLSKSGDPVPLFLDDPLVNVDDERTQSTLRVLHDLAEERQIFYFTQDPRVAEWAEELGSCKVIPMSA